jgi:uncharacterized protein
MGLKSIISALSMMLVISLGTGLVRADEHHRLALYISDNSPEKMTSVLNVAANVSRHYSGIGEEVEIKIIAYNAGTHMLRSDTSPVTKRLKSFGQSMPNVSFLACGNTLTSMNRSEGKVPPLMPDVEVVPAGVVTLIELKEAGWTLVKP